VVRPDARGEIAVKYVEGVVGIPRDFGRATAVEFGNGRIEIAGSSSARVSAEVDWDFVLEG
jgi:hypothetical protein